MVSEPETGADALTPSPALVEVVANAYHWAARNSCGPDNCPGVPECVYAEHLSWDAFAAALAAVSPILVAAGRTQAAAEALERAAAVVSLDGVPGLGSPDANEAVMTWLLAEAKAARIIEGDRP